MTEEKKEASIKIQTDMPVRHHFIMEDGRVYSITCPNNDSLATKFGTMTRIVAEFRRAFDDEREQIIAKAKKEAEEFEKGKKIVETTQEELSEAMESATVIKACGCSKPCQCDE